MYNDKRPAVSGRSFVGFEAVKDLSAFCQAALE